MSFVVFDDGQAVDQGSLVGLQKHWLNAGQLLVATEHLVDLLGETEEDFCDDMGPSLLCLGAALAITVSIMRRYSYTLTFGAFLLYTKPVQCTKSSSHSM